MPLKSNINRTRQYPERALRAKNRRKPLRTFHRSKAWRARRRGAEACYAADSGDFGRCYSSASRKLTPSFSHTPTQPCTPGVALVELVEESGRREQEQRLSQAVLALLQGRRRVQRQVFLQQSRDHRVEPVQPFMIYQFIRGDFLLVADRVHGGITTAWTSSLIARFWGGVWWTRGGGEGGRRKLAAHNAKGSDVLQN